MGDWSPAFPLHFRGSAGRGSSPPECLVRRLAPIPGPDAERVSPEKGFNPLAANSPKILWRASVGKGTSSVTVQEGRAYTLGSVGGNDTLYCLDTKSGRELWKTQYPMSLDPKLFEGGPRSTPTLDGNHVYPVSHQGDLQCFEALTGKKIWAKNYGKDFGGRRPDWGYSGSPLVHEDMLICDAGGPDASTVALEKATGKLLWKSGADAPGYATPVVATLDGHSTVIVFKAQALVGLDLKSGKELWRTGWKTDYDINAATRS